MPYLTRAIEQHGALVDLRVGVIEARRQLLVKHAMRVPDPVKVRAQIDTG